MMGLIDELNTQYIEETRILNDVKRCSEEIIKIQNGIGTSEYEKAIKAFGSVKNLRSKVKGRTFDLLEDTAKISENYFACQEVLYEYKKALLELHFNSDSLQAEINKVEEAQRKYSESNEAYKEKYNYSIDSLEAINKTIPQSVNDAIAKQARCVEELKKCAKEELNKDCKVELKITDSIEPVEELPDELLIARVHEEGTTQQILKDLGIANTYHKLAIDLRNAGNVSIKVGFDHIEDAELDAFIIAYILRFIESYPLGSAHVHIFDQNTNYLYKRLLGCFQDERLGENTRKIIQVHSSVNEISIFRDVVCEDIYKKIPVGKDLYSVYEHDKSDAFNLIILRDGLDDRSGFPSLETLNIVNSLVDSRDIGHKCGLRFLIVDNGASFTNTMSPSAQHIVDTIRSSSEIALDYTEDGFALGDKKVDVLNISDDLEQYIQERSSNIVELLGGKEKGFVSYEEISSGRMRETQESILYIPIGMSGGKPVELPFSCKDEDGTAAGSCISYMVIGQTGTGKSSFFDSLVINGCLRYSPKDLQFWLLDFKNGAASSKYRSCKIPHIRIVSENNKIDDALCLFQMIKEEMERRNNTIKKYNAADITDYNKKVSGSELEYFPRVIIVIDEVQEIFREEEASEIKMQIASISSKMRSSGMHLVMIGQNLSDGKTYMLKEAFLPSANGRICLRESQDMIKDSGFGEEFIERKKEISELSRGEAYISYGKDTIKKTKLSYASVQELNEEYFGRICEQYTDFSDIRPLTIGSKQRLSITAYRQGTTETYFDVISKIESKKAHYTAVIGEDSYRLSPLTMHFSQAENSSALLLGSDKKIASSLCASIALSLASQTVKMYLFNGDKTGIQDENGTVPHPFMYVCQKLDGKCDSIKNFRLNQLTDVMADIYSEYLERQEAVQKADEVLPMFSPIFLVINDLLGIESFANDDLVTKNAEYVSSDRDDENLPPHLRYNYTINESKTLNDSDKKRGFKAGVQTLMSTLLKNGYRYNIHLILAIRGDAYAWRGMRIASEINNIVLFNHTDYADQFDSPYYLKEMLRNIANEDEETMAVWVHSKARSKVRPVIYDLTRKEEEEYLLRLIEED